MIVGVVVGFGAAAEVVPEVLIMNFARSVVVAVAVEAASSRRVMELVLLFGQKWTLGLM